MQPQQPSMLKPALIAGGAFGVAGAIPFVNLINCACCALIIGCGLVAALLQSNQCRTANIAFGAGPGAQVGLLSGLVYGVVSGVLSALLNLTLGVGEWQTTLQQMEELGSVDPEVVDQMSRFMESTGPVVIVLFAIFISLLLGAIFATVGGLIGGSLFKVSPPSADAPGTSGVSPPPVRPIG